MAGFIKRSDRDQATLTSSVRRAGSARIVDELDLADFGFYHPPPGPND